MEALEINRGNGQSYGLIVYRKRLDLPESAELTIIGHIRDVAMVVVDDVQKTPKPEGAGAMLGFGFWTSKYLIFFCKMMTNLIAFGFYSNSSFTIEGSATGINTLDIIVENWGRVNFGGPEYFKQKKGLFEGSILVDGEEQSQWTAIPIELESKWIQRLVKFWY